MFRREEEVFFFDSVTCAFLYLFSLKEVQFFWFRHTCFLTFSLSLSHQISKSVRYLPVFLPPLSLSASKIEVEVCNGKES